VAKPAEPKMAVEYKNERCLVPAKIQHSSQKRAVANQTEANNSGARAFVLPCIKHPNGGNIKPGLIAMRSNGNLICSTLVLAMNGTAHSN